MFNILFQLKPSLPNMTMMGKGKRFHPRTHAISTGKQLTKNEGDFMLPTIVLYLRT